MLTGFARSFRTWLAASQPYLFAGLIYLAAISITTAYFWADASDYVDSVTDYQNGKYYEFWEFGHLLWRPLGWLVWTTFCDLSDPYYWRYQVFKIFQWFNYISGFGSALLMAYILRRLNVRDLVNILIVAAFVCSHAFLNFAQTGTSYVTALFFFILGIAFIIGPEPGRPYLTSVLAGISLALSAGFWIAFVWTIPAVIFAVPVLYGFNRPNLLRSTATLASFAAVIFLMFGSAILVLDLRSLDQVAGWVTHSSHGIETSGILRVIYGLPQSFAFMGDGSSQFKRFFLDETVNDLSVWKLVNVTFLNIVIFYLIGLYALRLLAKSVFNRRFLIFLAISVIPLAAFAATFDGAAVERYLPVVPIVFLALGLAVSINRYKPLNVLIIGFTVFLLLPNLFTLFNPLNTLISDDMRERSIFLNSVAADQDLVFTVVWNDPLINFTRSFPFHDLNLYANRKYLSLLTPGTSQTRTWKEEFAYRTLMAWENGNKVFLSTRAFSEEPKPEWNWVEGFDKNVKWSDIPDFCNRLDFNTYANESFVIITKNESNTSFLTAFAKEYNRSLYRQR